MRSTSSSAQHFKSNTDLESCHLFKTVLIADQGLDRADMCVPPLPPRVFTGCGLYCSSRNSERSDATGKGKPSYRAALSALRLPSLSPRIVCSCRCVVQEAKPLSGWLRKIPYACPNLGRHAIAVHILECLERERSDRIDLDQRPNGVIILP